MLSLPAGEQTITASGTVETLFELFPQAFLLA
jgi:hypothetical protein